VRPKYCSTVARWLWTRAPYQGQAGHHAGRPVRPPVRVRYQLPGAVHSARGLAVAQPVQEVLERLHLPEVRATEPLPEEVEGSAQGRGVLPGG
jgi:hypothetical protein